MTPSGPVLHRSAAANVFHLCVHKTGSQWIRLLLSEPRTYRYSGLTHFHYQSHLPGGVDPRRITERAFTRAFPPGTVASPVYIDHAHYAAIPKPASARAFFVMRDPRDITVSWFYSMKLSHGRFPGLEGIRGRLKDTELADGVTIAIDDLQERGLFDALRSWGRMPAEKSVRIVRYEDLIGPRQAEVFGEILAHCDIAMPDDVLRGLLEDGSFERLSGGRAPGEEDPASHFRKGIAGDWRNAFNDKAIEHFRKVTGDLAQELGYGG